MACFPLVISPHGDVHAIQNRDRLKQGAFRQFVSAAIAVRQRKTDREIARVLLSGSVKLTDNANCAIKRRLLLRSSDKL